MDAQQVWQERRRAALDAASAMSHHAEWVSAISGWWMREVDANGDSDQGAIVVDAEVVTLTPDGAQLADAINALASAASTGRPTPDRVTVLLVQGVAHALARTKPTLSSFERAASFCNETRDSFGVFEEAFVAECQLEPAMRARWIEVLETSASDRQSYGAAADTVLTRGVDEEKALRESGDYRTVWRNRPWSGWHRDTLLSRFQVLLDLDPSALARAIDAVPSQMMRQIIMEFLGLRRGPELACALLMAAPPAFDGSGKWTGSVFALMLLEVVAAHVQRTLLSRGFVQLGVTTKAPTGRDEIKTIYREFFAVVQSRSDARFLGRAYALEATRRATHPRPVPGVTWTAEEIVLEEAVDMLAATGASPSDLKREWDLRANSAEPSNPGVEESWLPHLLLAACLWGTQTYTTDPAPVLRPGAVPSPGATEIWSWYQEALVAGNAGFAGHLNPYGSAARWVFVTLALSMAWVSDPVSEMRATWDALYDQRFRGRMSAGDADAAKPSLHLLRVSRASLEWFVGGKTMGFGKPDIAAAMWRLLHHLSIQFLGSLPTDHLRPDRDAVTGLYAFIPHIFPDSWRTILVEDAPFLASDNVLCIVAAANVAQNGAGAAEVADCMKTAGCDPLLAGEALGLYSTRVEPRDPAVANALKLLDGFGATRPAGGP